MKQSARWTLTVTADVDRRVRKYLASAGRKGDLAAFVEEAVRARLLQLSMKTVPTYSRPSANDVEPVPPASSATSSDGSLAGESRGLGRGLGALLGARRRSARAGAGERCRLSLMQAGAFQPRREIHQQPLEELAASIKANGVIQPIVVRPLPAAERCGGARYEIVAGERRWQAAKLAGLKDIPTIVRELSDSQAVAVALIENIQREELTRGGGGAGAAAADRGVLADPPGGGGFGGAIARRGHESDSVAGFAGRGGGADRFEGFEHGTCAGAVGPRG